MATKSTLKAMLVQMTSTARRRLVRPHRNFQQFVAPLLALYDDNIAKLGIDGLTSASVREELRQYEALADDEAAAVALLGRIRDTRLRLSSHIWSTLLEIYARARTFARRDSRMAAAIADFTTFMKHRRRA